MSTETNTETTTDTVATNLIGTDPLAWLEQDKNRQSEDNADNTQSATVSESAGKPSASVMDLGETLNIRDLDELYQALTSATEKNNEVLLDVSHLRKVDAVSLQMLASFYQSAPTQGITVNWTGSSDAFREAVNITGLATILGLETD